MTHQLYRWADIHSSCLEGGLVEDVHLSQRSRRRYQVGLSRVMLDAIDLTVMFDLVLNYYLVLHRAVVLLDSVTWLYCFYYR